MFNEVKEVKSKLMLRELVSKVSEKKIQKKKKKKMANKDAAIGKPINEVVTPAFIISLPILTKNTSNMIENAKRLGVELRPHVKTHKV